MDTDCATSPARPPVRTILLVEDEESVRDITLCVLESAGYIVLPASGPEQAIQILQRCEGPIHLLLTDMIMPVMSGAELAAKVRSLRPELITVIMSGYPSSTACLHPQGVGSGWYLQKPFTVSQLLSRIAEALAFPCAQPAPGGERRLAI